MCVLWKTGHIYTVRDRAKVTSNQVAYVPSDEIFKNHRPWMTLKVSTALLRQELYIKL